MQCSSNNNNTRCKAAQINSIIMMAVGKKRIASWINMLFDQIILVKSYNNFWYCRLITLFCETTKPLLTAIRQLLHLFSIFNYAENYIWGIKNKIKLSIQYTAVANWDFCNSGLSFVDSFCLLASRKFCADSGSKYFQLAISLN